jgi:hypothetical protein
MILNQQIKLIVVLVITTLIQSCNTTSKISSAKTLDITSTITQKPTLADLDVKESKVTGTFSSKAPFNFEVVKQEAVANALRTVNADLLVEPKYESTVTTSSITVTVTGYPAFYKNFRAMKAEDLILLEPVIKKQDELSTGIIMKKSN